MSLSVDNTGYSSSQTQINAPSADASSNGDSVKIDPLTGKTIELPTSIKVSEETLARWRSATPLKETLSKEEQEKLTLTIRDLRNDVIARTSSGVSLNNPLFSDPITSSDGLTFSSWANNLKADSGISKEGLLTLVHDVLAYGFANQQSNITSAMQLSVKKAELTAIKDKYLDSSYQTQAEAAINSYVNQKISDEDTIGKALMEGEYRIGIEVGDTARAVWAQSQLQKYDTGTSDLQVKRQQIFALASGGNVDGWFDSFSHYLQTSSYGSDWEQQSIDALQNQWQQFRQRLG
ncbi:hypothetical protein [Dickeya fangzhongdai]|uniref:hypothetical protein n=1 Tax=Dickeya fangzhongdai TaxID=1778540 RepID=UPI0004F7EDD0|nr:hypothetical protein [Dickeya fangzhongdai]AIR69484.1 hypothetical protein LH89_09820 [Dickeya fangzhongdai]KGT99416.1 hypothetical protein NM75_04765 [Dickeya fangzhongdai]